MQPSRSRFLAIQAAGLLGVAALALPAAAQDPAADGQWAAPFDLPLIAIHAAMLPTGKVLLFSAEHGVPGIHGWLLDPTTLALTNAPPPAGWNPDCSGHSFLADGRLLVAGGTLQFNPLLGSRQAFWFDPFAEQWVETGSMARGRWYPTNLTLPDGRVMTLSGLDDTTGALNPDVEIWDPEGDGSWQVVAQKTVPYYPYLHLLPGGLVFRSGPDSSSETLDPATFTWTPVADTLAASRFEAPSVLLPPTSERVLLVGGSTGSGPPTNSAEIIDFTDAAPQWTLTAHMASARWEHAAVVLPDACRSSSIRSPRPGTRWPPTRSRACTTRARCCFPMPACSWRAATSSRAARSSRRPTSSKASGP